MYSPAKTKPTTVAPITAFVTLRARKTSSTIIANVKRERPSFGRGGVKRGPGWGVGGLSGEADDTECDLTARRDGGNVRLRKA